MYKIIKRTIKIILLVTIFTSLMLLLGIGYLAFTEYKPKDITPAIINNSNSSFQEIDISKPLTFISYNIGYGGLGHKQDFFMDGGKMVRASKKEIEENLSGIAQELKDNKADFYLLQEVDELSYRSYNINQVAYLGNELNLNSSFAYNFKCEFVPFPWPPIRKVASGLMTLSKFTATSSKRYSLPVPFKWPVRMANLKRCLLVNRYKLNQSDKELVVVNLHLEAYDDGKGKALQSKMLFDFLTKELNRGNYIIAGGDWNQLLPGAPSFPLKNINYWQPPKLNVDNLNHNLIFALDKNSYTNRLNNIVLKGNEDKAQYYSLDGYLLSNNLKIVEVKALNTNFKNADHLPVKLVFCFE